MSGVENKQKYVDSHEFSIPDPEKYCGESGRLHLPHSRTALKGGTAVRKKGLDELGATENLYLNTGNRLMWSNADECEAELS